MWRITATSATYVQVHKLLLDAVRCSRIHNAFSIGVLVRRPRIFHTDTLVDGAGGASFSATRPDYPTASEVLA